MQPRTGRMEIEDLTLWHFPSLTTQEATHLRAIALQNVDQRSHPLPCAEVEGLRRRVNPTRQELGALFAREEQPGVTALQEGVPIDRLRRAAELIDLVGLAKNVLRGRAC